MNDAEIVTAIVGFIAAARKLIPKLDGVYVIVFGLIVAQAASFIYSPDGEGIKAIIKHGGSLGFAGIGGMSGLSYIASKLGINFSSSLSVPPPPMPPTAQASLIVKSSDEEDKKPS